MLSGLFPEDVATTWGDPDAPAKPLFPEELALVANAVPKRQREFAKGRECARAALERFGHENSVLLSGESREPLWPKAVVGSITHTRGLCAVAVASTKHYAALGIDAEPAEPLAPEIAKRICGTSLPTAGALTAEVVPRLVFCVKEAVYKCQFPISRRFLGFDAVEVLLLDDGAFRARLLVDAPPFRAGVAFEGRWVRAGAHLVAGAWVRVQSPA